MFQLSIVFGYNWKYLPHTFIFQLKLAQFHNIIFDYVQIINDLEQVHRFDVLFFPIVFDY